MVVIGVHVALPSGHQWSSALTALQPESGFERLLEFAGVARVRTNIEDGSQSDTCPDVDVKNNLVAVTSYRVCCAVSKT